MSYSIKVILHNSELKGSQRKVQIRVIYDRKKYYCKTQFRLTAEQLEDGRVVNHPLSKSINASIQMKRLEIEDKIIRLINTGKDTAANIKEAVSGRFESRSFQEVTEYLIKTLKGRLATNTFHNYRVSAKKLNEFREGIKIHDCSYQTLTAFEAYLREKKYGTNTVSKYMQMIKSILNKAADLDYIDKSLFEKYKRPKTVLHLPVWLTETEIENLSDIVFVLKGEAQKQAGFYFLLCCFAGYRISDAKRFDYNKMVADDKIVLRATKNKEIVSIPVHTRLKRVLEYCRHNPFTLSEQKARDHVKTLCAAAGIHKDVKFHSARHSFAMLLMANGFTIDEVSRFIGDTPLTTTVYARVHNESLDKKVMERLG